MPPQVENAQQAWQGSHHAVDYKTKISYSHPGKREDGMEKFKHKVIITLEKNLS